MSIRLATPDDLDVMRDLLNREIRETTATWTTVERTPEAMYDWWAAVREDGFPVYVAESGGEFLGYANYARFRTWPGYWRSAENSVYVTEAAQTRGVGSALLDALAKQARRQKLIALIGVMGADRAGSIALHLKCGYREVGRLPGIGEKFGRRLDMVMMQRDL
jgi:phosphinothricin acetyltransferase